IGSSTFYALAQSPIWIVKTSVETAARPHTTPRAVQTLMPESRAIPIARELLAPGAQFLSPRFPLVHLEDPRPGPLARRPTLPLIFLQALHPPVSPPPPPPLPAP